MKKNESAEEAIEEKEIVEEERSAFTEGWGDDLLNNIEEDYQAVPELDQYEVDGIDEDDMDEIDPEARRLTKKETTESKFMVARIWLK